MSSQKNKNEISELIAAVRKGNQNAFVSLYENEVIPAAEAGLSAAVYTQVSDVEDETNGLLTYDRQVLKVDEEAMKATSDALFEAFAKANN